MVKFSDIDKFHSTKKGKFIFGIVEILAAWAIIARAIDTGSLWQYLLFALLVIGGTNNLIRALFPVWSNSNARGRTKKR